MSKHCKSLPSEKHEIVCTDEIDETACKKKWTNAAAKKLLKMNEDCNLTGGLQAKLVLAVGARVMTPKQG